AYSKVRTPARIDYRLEPCGTGFGACVVLTFSSDSDRSKSYQQRKSTQHRHECLCHIAGQCCCSQSTGRTDKGDLRDTINDLKTVSPLVASKRARRQDCRPHAAAQNCKVF